MTPKWDYFLFFYAPKWDYKYIFQIYIYIYIWRIEGEIIKIKNRRWKEISHGSLVQYLEILYGSLE
jgi:hypothetical protein